MEQALQNEGKLVNINGFDKGYMVNTVFSLFFNREDSQPSPTTNLHDPLQTESPSFVPRGLPTLDTLRMVMEQAQQLLRGNATAALSVCLKFFVLSF